MYGILNFEKSSAAISALRDVHDDGWCGRGSACEGCRISRVRCTGKLSATHCDRCKRLSKACRYITNNTLSRHNQQNRRKDYNPIHNPDDGHTRALASGRARGADGTGTGVAATTPGGADKDKTSALACDSDSPPAMLAGGDTAPLIGSIDDDAWWQSLDLNPITSSNGTLWSSSLAPLDTSHDHYTISADSDLPEPSATPDEAEQRSTPRLRAATISTTSSSVQQRMPAATNCSCLQALTSALFTLRKWQRDTSLEIERRSRGNSAAVHSPKREIGSFLMLFEESMVQLRVVEDCTFTCVLSQEMAVLLLLVIEQLARLLVSSESLSWCSGSLEDPSPPRRLQAAEGTTALEDSPLSSELHHFGTIGTYHLRDAIDQRIVVKALLEIRAKMLHGFITRVGSKMIPSGLAAIEFDLRKIQEELGKAGLQETNMRTPR